jgi:hypothetical protein
MPAREYSQQIRKRNSSWRAEICGFGNWFGRKIGAVAVSGVLPAPTGFKKGVG